MAILAGAKLAVLLAMGVVSQPSGALKAVAQAPMQTPGQVSGQTPALPSAAAAPAPIVAVASPAKAVEAVRAAILDDSLALAAQQAPAPVPAEKKPSQPAQPESVLTIQQIKARAEAMDRQEQALKTMEADLNARLARLQELETTLKGMLSEAKSIKEEKMRHLIDVYTNMKPKQAASVLETLDENIAVKILAGMKGRQAGEILTGVSAKKAAKLSEELTKLQIGPDLPEKP